MKGTYLSGWEAGILLLCFPKPLTRQHFHLKSFYIGNLVFSEPRFQSSRISLIRGCLPPLRHTFATPEEKALPLALCAG
jgi:hypothetical protein